MCLGRALDADGTPGVAEQGQSRGTQTGLQLSSSHPRQAEMHHCIQGNPCADLGMT
jgi:hypothetical protein